MLFAIMVLMNNEKRGIVCSDKKAAFLKHTAGGIRIFTSGVGEKYGSTERVCHFFDMFFRF